MQEKTELERRWENEGVDTVPQSLLEEAKKNIEELRAHEEPVVATQEKEIIPSPLVEADVEEPEPLVIISVNNRFIFGGLVDMMDDSSCILSYPLAFIEMPKEIDGRVQVVTAFQKLIQTVSVPRAMEFRRDSLLLLNYADRSAQALASSYEETFKALKLHEMGMYTPDAEKFKNGLN